MMPFLADAVLYSMPISALLSVPVDLLATNIYISLAVKAPKEMSSV